MGNVTINDALGDMPMDEFRQVMHQVTERMARFLEDPKQWRVLPDVAPGDVRAALPKNAPAEPESFDAILADFDRLIMPAMTHWNHPGFMAYFANTGSAAGIVAEALIASLNVNVMLWRSGPAGTELEEVTTAWLRDLMSLPADFDGTITDTASSSTLYALAAAREMLVDLRIREEGLAGRPDVPRLAVYCSEEAHSSVDKAVLTLGLGMRGVRRVAADENYAMKPDALREMIASDRKQGIRPMAVVASVGTTSTTAIDPVNAIADVCAEEGVWLHIDAAYGGSAALLPEMKYILEGCERAHSLVVNPHKWMFVPMDCSVLYTRRPDLLRRAFSLVPDYLVTAEGDSGARNLMDYGVSLGRRFRALKLWFVLRYFGSIGIAARIREHIRLASLLSAWIDETPGFERLAPQHFSTVVFRYVRPDQNEAQLEAHNAAIIDRVNASGEIFMAQTKAKGRYALRLAIGNVRTDEAVVRRAWELIQNAARVT